MKTSTFLFGSLNHFRAYQVLARARNAGYEIIEEKISIEYRSIIEMRCTKDQFDALLESVYADEQKTGGDKRVDPCDGQ